MTAFRPPTAAQQIATAALLGLPLDVRRRSDLPSRIAAGAELTAVDVDQIRTVLAGAGTDPAGALAVRLLGGEPMRRAVAAAATSEQAAGMPDPGPHTGAMIALIPDTDQAAELAVSDGLPADELHVTLAYLGPADELDDDTRSVIVSQTSKAMEVLDGPIVAEFGHISHLGPTDEPAAVAYELTAPELHRFRETLVSALRIAGVEPSNRYAFRPHMTVTYLDRDSAGDQYPEGPVSEPVRLEMTKIMIRFGSDHEDILTVGSSDLLPVTAAAGGSGLRLLDDALTGLNRELASLDADTGVEIRSAIDIGWRSALDRVGRMATRAASAADQSRYRELSPAIVATSADLSAVNVDALIAPAVSDVAAHVQRVVDRTHAQVAAVIGDTLDVDIDDVWPSAGDVAARLESAMTQQLQIALGRLGDIGRIDPTDGDVDPLVPPYQLCRDTLAFAGGADLGLHTDIRRDAAGRPLRAATAGADSIPLGPGSVDAVRQSILAHGTVDVVTAAARRRAGGRISAELSAELASAADRMSGRSELPPLEQITVSTWRLNKNGRAAVNLPRHEKLAGITVSAESDLAAVADAATDPGDWPGVSYSHPGDHRYCHCGWDTEIRLVPVQLALPV